MGSAQRPSWRALKHGDHLSGKLKRFSSTRLETRTTECNSCTSSRGKRSVFARLALQPCAQLFFWTGDIECARAFRLAASVGSRGAWAARLLATRGWRAARSPLTFQFRATESLIAVAALCPIISLFLFHNVCFRVIDNDMICFSRSAQRFVPSAHGGLVSQFEIRNDGEETRQEGREDNRRRQGDQEGGPSSMRSKCSCPRAMSEFFGNDAFGYRALLHPIWRAGIGPEEATCVSRPARAAATVATNDGSGGHGAAGGLGESNACRQLQT